MPEIHPTTWIHPTAVTAAQVVTPIEEMSMVEAKTLIKQNPNSFLNLLLPEVKLPEGADKKALVYQKIKANLNSFLQLGVLIEDLEAGIYVYRLTQNDKSYTGFWVCSSVDDLRSGVIKPHEATRPEREQQLSEYLSLTGIDANPVLITYRADKSIDRLLRMITTAGNADLAFRAGNTMHELWKVSDFSLLSTVSCEFSKVKSAYIADGHHRAKAAVIAAKLWGVDRFSSVYMADNQLKLRSYYRLVADGININQNVLMTRLSEFYKISPRPDSNLLKGQIDFYFKKAWFRLTPKIEHIENATLEQIDTYRLDKTIIKGILQISQSESDKRLSYVAGTHSDTEVANIVDKGDYVMAFKTNPPTFEELFNVAESGNFMPAKSTAFEPKFPVGLLTHKY